MLIKVKMQFCKYANSKFDLRIECKSLVMKIENEMELPKPTFFMCNLFYDLTCTTYQDYVLLFSSYSCFESKQVTFMEEMKAILILCIFV